jgi:hypothetical protein
MPASPALRIISGVVGASLMVFSWMLVVVGFNETLTQFRQHLLPQDPIGLTPIGWEVVYPSFGVRLILLSLYALYPLLRKRMEKPFSA